MSKLNENEMGDRMMIGAPYYQGGGSADLGTPSSPDISQSPDKKFKYPQTASSTSDISLPIPGDEETPEEYPNPDDFESDVNAIKHVVTPDEILAGMQYELKRMVFKRKDRAKEIVVSNLKKDPKFYSRLHMMQVNENGVRIDAIKDIIKEMQKQNKKRKKF